MAVFVIHVYLSAVVFVVAAAAAAPLTRHLRLSRSLFHAPLLSPSGIANGNLGKLKAAKRENNANNKANGKLCPGEQQQQQQQLICPQMWLRIYNVHLAQTLDSSKFDFHFQFSIEKVLS